MFPLVMPNSWCVAYQAWKAPKAFIRPKEQKRMTVDPSSVNALGRVLFDDADDGETAVGDELVARLGNDDACERHFSASSSWIVSPI